MILTPRLRLRAFEPEDADAWATMNEDPRVMEFFVEPTPRARSYEQAELVRERLERNGYGWFVIERLDRPGFAGTVAIDDIRFDVPFEPKREIGWRLPVESWGQGYATEAASALLRYASETLGWTQIVSFTSKLNVRSQRVMQRLGMTHDSKYDFDHPRIPIEHPLRAHVLYRLNV